jgi:hypothetical protein
MFLFLFYFAILCSNTSKKKNRLLRQHLIPKIQSGLIFLTRQTFKLVHEADNEAFQRIFRFDMNTFLLIEKRFAIPYERARMCPDYHPRKFRIHTRPNRRYFSTREALLLLLRFLATKQNFDDITLSSSGLSSCLSHTLRHALHSLLIAMRQWRTARLSLPANNNEAMNLSNITKNYIFKRYEKWINGNFIGAIDGTAIIRERPHDSVWQTTNHNYKTSKTSTKSLFTQLFDGTYGSCIVCFVGSGHDVKLCTWLHIADEMAHLHSSFQIVSDTAFGTSNRIVRPLTEDEYANICGTPEEQSMVASASVLLSSLRMSSEWGIGGLCQCWQCLKVPLPADDHLYGKLLWELCLCLFNVRVRKLGIGQVYSTFMK